MNLENMLKSSQNSAQNALDLAKISAQNAATSALESAKNAALSASKIALDSTKAALDSIESAAQNAANKIEIASQNALDSMQNAAYSAANKIESAAQNAANKIENIAQNATKALKSEKLKPLKIGKHIIKLPIIQGGMGIGISWDELAGSVSKCGALGVISCVGTGYYKNGVFAKLLKGKPQDSANFYSRSALFEIFKNARARCGSAPLGANILYAINDYGRVVRDACEAGANLIITGAGLPTNMPEFTAEFPDVALVPIVSSAKALKILCKRWAGRYKRMPDAVIVEGPKSGGHQGANFEDCFKAEFQLEAILPQVVEEAKSWGKMPIIAAGGIWDRNDISTMLNLGASGVQMGTRFLGASECDAKYYAKIMPSLKESDIELVKSPVGYPARAITNLGVIAAVRGKSEAPAPKVACISNCVSPCERGVEAKKVGYCIADGLGAAYNGDPINGLYFTGSNGYKITQIQSVAEILGELVGAENLSENSSENLELAMAKVPQ